NWSEYVALTASEEEPLMSGDHTLDLRSLEAYATTGYHASGNTPMTLMYWVNYASVTGADRQVMGSHDGGYQRFYLGIDRQNDHSSGIGRAYRENDDSGLSAESWSHLALSYDPVTREGVVYVNGQAVHTHSYITFNEASSRALMLGARNGEQGADSFINGQVDDVQVWGRALS
ncbi:LamG domain-containing protein, partial [Grimontia marina]